MSLSVRFDRRAAVSAKLAMAASIAAPPLAEEAMRSPEMTALMLCIGKS